ncbi:MAG: hypothetical protein MUC28_03550 [Planctomycetes bacterium]|nr:hypothetical protein [Planctomycetota bacterium]
MPKAKEKKAKTSSAGASGKWPEVMDNLIEVAKMAKEKYDQIDPATKKKITAAAVGTIAAAAIALGLKKAVKKK